MTRKPSLRSGFTEHNDSETFAAFGFPAIHNDSETSLRSGFL